VFAALLHATWQAMVKASPDKLLSLTAINILSGLVGLCLLPFAAVPSTEVWLILCVSVPIHFSYKLALAAMYKDGDLSHAYPFARGITPLLVGLLAYTVIGEIPSPGQIAGILCIAISLLLLACENGFAGLAAPRSLSFAALAGILVAIYTLVDGIGVRTAESWFSFMAWFFLVDAVVFVLAVRFKRGARLWRMIAERRTASLASGLVAITSYGVFLWALHLGAMGAVAALRETSLVFAAVIGVVVLKEQLKATRIVATLLILTGIVMIAVAF